jgi:hydrogenase maturation protease
MKAHTLILGLGNPLMADDGAGIRVVELLRQLPLPEGVVVQDGGTAGMGLVPEMDGYQRVILIDCAVVNARPGEWRRFTLDEAKLLPAGSTRREGSPRQDDSPLSLHRTSLRDALRLADAVNLLPPEIVIYGIQPAHVEWDRPMSDEVAAALPAIVQAVLDEASGSTAQTPALAWPVQGTHGVSQVEEWYSSASSSQKGRKHGKDSHH